MQNHANKRFKHTHANVMAAIAIGAMLVFSVAGTKAFADVVHENIINADALDNTVTEGQKVEIRYWITQEPASQDTQGGCNIDGAATATIHLSFDSSILSGPSSVTIQECSGASAGEIATFTALKAGQASISISSVTDTSTGTGTYKTTGTTESITVEEDTPPPPSDTTAPEITYTLDPATPDGSNDWYKSNVAIDWTVTDDESEPTIDSGCEDQTITADTDSSGVTLSCEAHSDGGEAEPVSVTIKKDATAPTVSLAVGDNGIAAGGSYFFGFVPSQPTCEASDTTPGSGLDGECTVAGFGDSVGEHTVKATANDNAGNTGESESITYTVKKWDLTGFYQPVDMGSTMNTVKGGSTVPFKFEIFAATEFTSTTFNGNPIGTFSAKKVSCTPGGEDAIEQVVTATGGTALRYDTTSGQFVYNWQTPKGAGICYDTTFTDQSGATLTAKFKTK